MKRYLNSLKTHAQTQFHRSSVRDVRAMPPLFAMAILTMGASCTAACFWRLPSIALEMLLVDISFSSKHHDTGGREGS